MPIASWVFLAAYGAGNLFVASRGLMPGLDHAGHFGGLVSGFLGGLLVRRKVVRIERERRVAEGLGGEEEEDGQGELMRWFSVR